MRKNTIFMLLAALLFVSGAALAEEERLTLPSGIIAVADEAYAGCARVKEVLLPDTLQSIGARAFAGCAFPEILIPSGVTMIGENSFPEGTVIISEDDAYARTWAQENGYPWMRRPRYFALLIGQAYSGTTIR